MKRKSNLVLFVCITFAIIMLSISTTLALVRDDESKLGNILKFEKVAIMGDVEGGSKLSVNIDDRNVGNTIEIIGENFSGKELYIKPAEETREMYLRFKVYFTFGDEELDDANKEALNSFMAEDGFPMGFEVYSNEDYKFVKSNGWAYLITKDSEDLLKVVTEDDHDTKFILCNKYIMALDLQYETHIINIIETNNLGHLQMKVEAQAIQALGLANLTDEENEEILSSGNVSLEEQFGNATIADWEKAYQDNIDFANTSGLPTVVKNSLNDWSWEEISGASNIIERAFQEGFLKIEQKTISGTSTKYDEIVTTKPVFIIDNVKVKYNTIGTYGKAGYDRIFTFVERGIKSEIHLKDEKVLSTTSYGDVTMMVSNFLHDDKASGGKAGITLTSKTIIPNVTKRHNYNTTDCYYGNYGELRQFLSYEYLTAVKNTIGDNIIKTVSKGANVSKEGIDYKTTIYADDNLWVLDTNELFGGYSKGMTWYPIYVTNADRIKSNKVYATRRSRVKKYTWSGGYGLGPTGSYVNANGTNGSFGTDKYYVAFGFCI